MSQSFASVRSYYFRELCAEAGFRNEAIDTWTLATFRTVHRMADAQALMWRRRVANRYNPATRRWEQGR